MVRRSGTRAPDECCDRTAGAYRRSSEYLRQDPGQGEGAMWYHVSIQAVDFQCADITLATKTMGVRGRIARDRAAAVREWVAGQWFCQREARTVGSAPSLELS